MDTSINPKALWDLSYGMYIVTSAVDGKLNGQIVNTVFQVSAEPPKVAVSINKLNLTHDYIQKSGVLAISTLEEQASMTLIGLFGFKSGRDVDKLSQTSFKLGATGCPIVLEGALSALEGRVVGSADGGTHTVFIVEVTGAEILKEGPPLLYAYYQTVKKGHAPKNAPTYKEDLAPAYEPSQGRYRCAICGYLYDPESGDPDGHVPPGTAFEDLPPDWTCPLCGAAQENFSPQG
jgi:flavin reductase (DIM6/NTAB) family NADH-FMN oxidoreductase RutF/rubredoxin